MFLFGATFVILYIFLYFIVFLIRTGKRPVETSNFIYQINVPVTVKLNLLFVIKNINIHENEENLETSLNDSSIIDEILDEDDLLNHLTPNDVIDKIQMYDSTV